MRTELALDVTAKQLIRDCQDRLVAAEQEPRLVDKFTNAYIGMDSIGLTETREIVYAELSLYARPASIRELAAATKYAIPHLEKVLDHEWFKKKGNRYVIVEQQERE